MHPESKMIYYEMPSLVFGAGTFNPQHNKDPYAMDTTGLILKALSCGFRAFDTSPHYGPSEELLGRAFEAAQSQHNYSRKDLFLISKAGRLGPSEFDYSVEGIRASVKTSLARLKTSFLDVVYCHDVEYVSADEVLTAVRELRRLRDEEKIINYVGISGYPLDTLVGLAARVRDETGEPLDIVQTYAHYTLQNTLLAKEGARRLQAAGVGVVTNASPLGMGFLRRAGPPQGVGDFHPASSELRAAVKRASDFCDSHGERLELVAIRYALEGWLAEGASVGSYIVPSMNATSEGPPVDPTRVRKPKKSGVSVIGISSISELDASVRIWNSVVNGLDSEDRDASNDTVRQRQATLELAHRVRELLGDWYDYRWASPPAGFVNQRSSC